MYGIMSIFNLITLLNPSVHTGLTSWIIGNKVSVVDDMISTKVKKIE